MSQNSVISQAERFLGRGSALGRDLDSQKLGITIYRLLARGEPVSVADLSRTLGWPDEETEQGLESYASSLLVRDEAGRITAFTGLDLSPTDHELTLDGVTLHTWCAIDALFIPEIVNLDGSLITRCPATGARIVVEMNTTEIVAAAPETAVLSLVGADEDTAAVDVRSNFCNHVSLFTDASAFDAWADGKTGVTRVPLAEAHEIGHRRNVARYPDIDFSTFDPAPKEEAVNV